LASTEQMQPPARARGPSTPIAHRAHHAGLVHEERVDGGEVEGDDLFARRARIGDEGAVSLGSALIAEEDLGLLVAHEERRRRADLRRDAAEDRALGDGEQPRARAREML